jgi:t-SNARE complex subunit (syntaxin)
VYDYLHKLVDNLIFSQFLSARKADLKKGFQHLVVVVLVLVVVVVVVVGGGGTRAKKRF